MQVLTHIFNKKKLCVYLIAPVIGFKIYKRIFYLAINTATTLLLVSRAKVATPCSTGGKVLVVRCRWLYSGELL